MDIYTYLQNDHQKVNDLFKKITSATSSDTRKNLLEEIQQELMLHAETEHQTFYKRLAQENNMKDVIQHADKEHEKIEAQLKKLSGLSFEDKSWKEQLELLKNIVSHHVKEEETEIFQQAQKILSSQESKKLAEDMEHLKKMKLK